MVKKLIATTAMAATLAGMFATTAFAAETPEWNTNGGQSTVEGESTAIQPTIEVELPGDLAFGINPLYLDADEDGTADAQIVTGQYTITNYSNIDVLVTSSTTVAAGEGVTDIKFSDAAEGEWDTKTKELVSVADKRNVLLVQMLPTSAATEKDGEVSLTMNTFTPGTTNKSDVAGKVLSDTAAEVKFLLKKAGENFNAGSVSGFTFAGAVDPASVFNEGDVKVTTVFTLKTLTDKESVDGLLYEGLKLNSGTYDATVVQDKS